MKKITTLFQKNPADLGRVINLPHPDNLWVFRGQQGINWKATRKYDGTACAIINGELYKRYDAKLNKKGKRKPVPEGAIPCQDPDPKSGHWPHWVKCNRENPADQYHFEAFDNQKYHHDGTYELCGPKVQKNAEWYPKHYLLMHGREVLTLPSLDFVELCDYLMDKDIEGIVFHEINGDRMCKLRKSDFGIKRIPPEAPDRIYVEELII